MKKLFSVSLIAIIMIAACTSCKKHHSSSAQATALNGIAAQGKWKVAHFADNGVDETAHFTGYEFQFNSNGTVTATKAGTTVSGTWSTGNDDDTVKFILHFTSPSDFIDLNEDWHVLQQSSSNITLQHVSGGNGGTDNLIFEKI